MDLTGSNSESNKRRVLFARLVLIFIFIFSASFSNAERLPVKTYTVADGLLRDVVYRIKQDSRGFMWFCTTEGISRFDGATMTNFTVADGLPNRIVGDFLETRNGTIYIATGKGLARLNPHGVRGSAENPLFTVVLPENEKAQNIKTLFEDENVQTWVGTSDGLYKLIETGGQIRLENVPLGEPLKISGSAISAPSPNTISVSAIRSDRRGTLWIGTNGGGLFRLAPDGNVRRFTTDNTAELGDNKITDLLEDRDGQIFLTKRSDEFGGLCRLDAESNGNPFKKCYTTGDGLGSNWIRDILQTKDGQIWLATTPGLCRFQTDNPASVCKTYKAQNDLCDDITALAEDREGNLWLGSPCGVKKIARYGFTTYQMSDENSGEYHVNSILEDSMGELFISTFNNENAVGRFDDDKFSFVKPRLPAYVNYHGWGWQQTVLHDSKGAWWIPTGYGVFRSPDNTNFENLADAPLIRQETGAKGTEVFRLFEDSRGDIWMMTTNSANELFRWERATDVWHDYTREVGFSDYRVGSAIVEDSHGNVWFGATSDHQNSALIRYRDGEFLVLDQSAGAPTGWIQDLFLDSRGRLWIASDTDGVWRVNETDAEKLEFVKYTILNGLTSNSTASVTEDQYGRIYIGTWRGIDRLTPDTGQIENFTTADGLPAGFVESSFRDRKNNLWFATDRGLTRFVPEPVRTRQPPTILITGWRVNGEPQSVSILGEAEIPTLDLTSDQRQITIDFLGLGESLGEKIKYEYRFGDADWMPTGERVLNFANLAAGEYKFEVRAQTADETYSLSPASVSFKIAAPIWQRWWFIALLALAFGLVIYLIYKNRLRRFLELEKVRTRIATDLHDDIGANLTRISLLSEVAKQKSDNGNEQMLSSIAEIARESVASMNDIVWAIAPEHDGLSDLTIRMRRHAEEIFALRDIDLEFNAPTANAGVQLSVGSRRDLLLIFKEAVSNAAKHSDCSKVAIDFSLKNSFLRLRIEDDGRGFDANEIFDGQGLRSMTRRAQSLGGDLTIVSSDGTIVKFEMNLRKNSELRLL